MQVTLSIAIFSTLACLSADCDPWKFHREGKETFSIPDADAQKRSAKGIKKLVETFARTHPGKRESLTRELRKLARATNKDVPYRYVAYREAIESAATAGEVSLAVQILDEFTRSFPDLDPLAEKAKLLKRIAKARKERAVLTAVAEAYLNLAQDAVAEDDYDTAVKALKAAGRQAAIVKDDGLKRASRELTTRVRKIRDEYQRRRIGEAIEKARKNPADGEAVWTVGRFLCLAKENWKKGLPYLRDNSVNIAFASVARRDLAGPTAPRKRLSLAEEWWKLARQSRGGDRSTLLKRAGYWYTKARSGLEELADVETIIKVKKRLSRISKELKGERTRFRLETLLADASLVLTFDFMTQYEAAGRRYVKDLSGRDNHGIIVGARLVNGRAAGALSLDGKESFATSPAPVRGFPVGNAPRTVTAWIKTSDKDDSRSQNFFHYGSSGRGLDLSWRRKVSFGVTYPSERVRSDISVDDGKWHQVAGVYEGSETNKIRVYVDGFEDRSSVLCKEPNTPVSTWRIGSFAGQRNSFRGQVDELIVFKRALSKDEIKFLYDSQKSSGMSSGRLRLR